MKIPFSPPRIDEKNIEAVTEVLRSGWITTGPKTKEFERRIAAYCGIKNVLCVNSASAGLELMLRWFGVTEGDEVIVPAYTYTATASMVLHCGARPVMVDVGDDFNIDIKKIRAAITPHTKAIMPVDLGGWPCDYDEINALVRENSIVKLFSPNSEEQKMLGRIMVLSDSAHSIGAEYKGKKSGSLTDASVFSFHAVKNLTTAEGGAICLNLPQPFDNGKIYKQLCVKSLHGQSKDAFSKMQLGNWRYDIVEPGYKCNMTDILAAIGLVELERYENDMLVRRKKIFDKYSEAFSQYDCFKIPTYQTQDKKSSYHLYLLRINNITEQTRDAILQKIFEQEVTVNVHYIPLPMLSCYKNRGYKIEDYPKTFENYSCEITLPVYYDLTDEQVEFVIQTVVKATLECEN
ncbi:MAG: DegT/DnrJ/EryC1/StrS family aminotransferase [Bacteroidales bacterium]|nr:DegT/DnrJ/EryC1/StrS family aminotransferase [Bacteroidales bacterium]